MPRVTLVANGFRGMNRRAGMAGNDAAPPDQGPQPIPTFELRNIDVSRLPEALVACPTPKNLVEYATTDTTEPIGTT